MNLWLYWLGSLCQQNNWDLYIYLCDYLLYTWSSNCPKATQPNNWDLCIYLSCFETHFSTQLCKFKCLTTFTSSTFNDQRKYTGHASKPFIKQSEVKSAVNSSWQKACGLVANWNVGFLIDKTQHNIQILDTLISIFN